MEPTPLRVGIVGARGIGRHHAKWYATAGCEVAAIYGTTEASAREAAAALHESFGFDGQVFHSWERFLAEGEFEACSVCSPAEWHGPQARQLAAAGRHVLCEKPMVWRWDAEPLRLLEEATAVVEAAARHAVLFALNAQYPAVLDGWRELYRRARGTEPEFRSFYFLLETKSPPRSPHGPAEAWVDLGPHPLALLDALAPGGIDWDTLRHRDGERETIVEFDWVAGDRRIAAHIECRRTADGRIRRRLGNQDLIADYEGANLGGEFCTRLRAENHEWVGKDLMRVSVERFVEAVRTGNASRLLVGPLAALRQQEALVGVWERCWR